MCQCCEPERFIIHFRKIEIPNYYRDMIKRNINPSTDYAKHPIINREIEMAKAMVLQRNPDLKGFDFGNEVVDYGNFVELRILV